MLQKSNYLDYFELPVVLISTDHTLAGMKYGEKAMLFPVMKTDTMK